MSRRPGAKDSDFGKDSKKMSGNVGVAAPSFTPEKPSTTIGDDRFPRYRSHSGESMALVPYSSNESGSRSQHYGAGVSSGYHSSDWNTKSKTGFVGLSNQGATCYMNSLIQTLYMSPEFRTALYKWDFNDYYEKRKADYKPENLDIKGKSNEEIEELKRAAFEKESIPRQLQLLFGRLQTSELRAVKTKDLTNSFGWKDSDAFTQHDVQELCRVLFDALEKVFKGTQQENFINELYQGEMKDYVRCKECNGESSRSDKYLDIPLVIRGFGETKSIKSVEEALYKFTQPEVLEGDNQYKCDRCNKKVDAIKGLKLSSSPYLLSLQLKRFDFDYETFRRIKLNDRVSFPLVLDMNQFLEDSTDKPSKRKRNEDEEGMEKDTEMVDANNNNNNNNENNNNNKTQTIEDGKINGKSEEENWSTYDPQKALENGQYAYELFSVLIHRGSALGGHYYAYIKSFETNKWYEFNDSSVSEIDVEDLKKTFGEEDRPKSGFAQYYYSSANAYMLMYRKIDKEKNKIKVEENDMNPELRNRIQTENDKRKNKELEKEKEREMVRLKVYYEMIEKELKLHQSTTIEETVKQAAELFGLNSRFPPDCIRMRNYQVTNDIPGEVYDGEEIKKKTLEESRMYNGKTVILETKREGDIFEEYNASDMQIKVIKYDHINNKFNNPVAVYVDKDGTLKDLKKLLEAKFGIPQDQQRIVREAFMYSGPSAKVLIGDDGQIRMDHRILEAHKIYLEQCTDFESESPSFGEIERTRNMIEIKFNNIGKEEASNVLNVSKKITFGELKKMIQSTINIPLDDFKVSRGNINWKVEIKNEQDSLDDCKLMDGSRLYVEKGKPLKDGESTLKFYLFDPFQKRIKEQFEELFEIPIQEDIPIAKLRELLSKTIMEEKKIEIEPAKIRIREMYTRSPTKIYKDKDTLKDSATYLYSGKCFAIQELDEPEDVKTEQDIAIFVQQFYPSKYETGNKIEITVSEDMHVNDFKKLLSEKYNISTIGIAKAMGSWPGPDPLEIPDLYWDREVPEHSLMAKAGTLGSMPLYLRDGDIVYFRDNTEPLKELSKEEKRKLEKESNIKKSRPSYHAKEEALHINVKV